MAARLDELQRLAAAQPDDPLTHYAVALELTHQERWDEALTTSEQTLAVDPDYAPALLLKARAELKLDRRDAARQTLQRGIAAALASGDTHAADKMRELLETME